MTISSVHCIRCKPVAQQREAALSKLTASHALQYQHSTTGCAVQVLCWLERRTMLESSGACVSRASCIATMSTSSSCSPKSAADWEAKVNFLKTRLNIHVHALMHAAVSSFLRGTRNHMPLDLESSAWLRQMLLHVIGTAASGSCTPAW